MVDGLYTFLWLNVRGAVNCDGFKLSNQIKRFILRIEGVEHFSLTYQINIGIWMGAACKYLVQEMNWTNNTI